MKCLYVTKDFLAPDLLLRIKNEGHEVYLACKEKEVDVLKGTIKRIDYEKRFKAAEYCDLVIYDDKSEGEVTELRAKGISVIGGSKKADEIELDRVKANKIAETCGMLVPKVEQVNGLKEAKKFIEEKGGKWVLKQMGKLDGIKGLNAVAKMDNSEDVIAVIDMLLDKWPEGLKQEFVVQEKIEGHEFACGSYWNGIEFQKDKDGDEICEENWEHKPLMAGNMGEACYSDDTEVLTNRGFKYFKDLDKTELIAQVDPKTFEISYVKPEKYYDYWYEGDMIHFKSRQMDTLVTPNHWMFVSPYKENKYKKVQAKDTQDLYKMKQAASWSGKKIDKFVFPSFIAPNGGSGRLMKEIEMDGDIFCKLLGIYVAEGSTTKEGKIYISQFGENIDKIEHLFEDFPLRIRKSKVGYIINSVQIARWLKLETGAYAVEKRIPEIIKNASKEQIRIFLDAFNLGDGDIHGGQKRYHSTSKRLIDDIQELLVKLGIASTIYEDENQRAQTKIVEKYRCNCKPCYSCEERKNDAAWIRGHKKIVPYIGHVYCVKVPTHLLVVRRNGRTLVCGNTGEQYTVMHYVKAKDSKLFKETLDKFRLLLKKIEFRGDFDINCIVNEKGVYFLEFTPRMGVPATSAQIAIQKSPWFDFLKAMADGQQCEEYSYNQGYCIVSWLYTKPFPAVNSKKIQDMAEKIFAGKKDDSSIVELMNYKLSDSYGLPVMFKEKLSKEELNELHFDAVMMDKGQLRVANSDGYVLTVTGMGNTVDEAAEKVECLLKKIVVPKGFYRNDFKKSNYHKSRNDLIEWGFLHEEKDEDELEVIKKQIKEVLKK